jgi:hypothetical protein
MIHESLKFLAEEVNKYLNIKMPLPGNIPVRLVVSNISAAGDAQANIDPKINDQAVLSLVNVEEDRVAKQQEHFTKTDTSTVYKNPPLYLNFYILFAMNRTVYADNLKILGYIIQFFQHQYVFTPITHPNLDPSIQRMIVDMHNMSFEQANHLWSILGGKYVPSVLYKVRQVTANEDAIISESGLIKEIELNDKTKAVVS